MPIDTTEERRAALQLGKPWTVVLPDADGAFDDADRAILTHVYSLVAAPVPPIPPAPTPTVPSHGVITTGSRWRPPPLLPKRFLPQPRQRETHIVTVDLFISIDIDVRPYNRSYAQVEITSPIGIEVNAVTQTKMMTSASIDVKMTVQIGQIQSKAYVGDSPIQVTKLFDRMLSTSRFAGPTEQDYEEAWLLDLPIEVVRAKEPAIDDRTRE